MGHKRVGHYLISLPLPLKDGRSLHCYLMTTNSRAGIEQACERMVNVAEDLVGGSILPMFVSTGPLDEEHTGIVRGILSEMPEVKENLATATNFHITIFVPTTEIDARLMEIH
jgi:hypothetical protein